MCRGKTKPTNSPKTMWGNPWWGNCDNEWRIKVPRINLLLKWHHPHILKVSICPDKNPCSSILFTQFNILPLYILHTIYTWYFSLVHYDKLKKYLAQPTQHNPLLCSTRSYKLKYTPFDNPMHYKYTCYVKAGRWLPPDIPLRDRLCGILTIKNEPIYTSYEPLRRFYFAPFNIIPSPSSEKWHTYTRSRLHAYYPIFAPYFWHYKLLSFHYLTFNLAHAIYELLNLSGNRSSMPSFYSIKRVKPKYFTINSWLHTKNHSHFKI